MCLMAARAAWPSIDGGAGLDPVVRRAIEKLKPE
jgi:hypothetical protein